MLIRPASGRKRCGMLSHVARPITTAFFLFFSPPTSCVVSFPLVTLAKYFISCGKRQGSLPTCPIPFFVVAATMSVTRLIDENNAMRWKDVYFVKLVSNEEKIIGRLVISAIGLTITRPQRCESNAYQMMIYLG